MNNSLKIIPIGGLGEIGKNLTILETNKEIIIIDCGISFPDIELLGVDVLIPDFSYLKKKREKVKGLILTHGHEDHVGAATYLLKEMNIPVYGTKLTLGILKNKIQERTTASYDLRIVKAGDTISFSDFFVELINVNHSIADAVALAIQTPVGTVIHTGDFKFDLTPAQGNMIDLVRFGEYGKAGVRLLMSESTNAEKNGKTDSEQVVSKKFEELFEKYKENRITIATFSSNVYRLQNIIKLSEKHNRKVVITGRSMLNIIGTAMELGYIKASEGTIIPPEAVNSLEPNQVTIITTGSQGEPMSALFRMAFSEHKTIQLSESDVVILSSNAIPGNEKLVNNMINKLLELGVTIVYGSNEKVHVSGHGCRDELAMIQALVKPELFMPIHGETKQLLAHKSLAQEMGISENNIFIMHNGNILELTKKTAKILEQEIKIEPVFVEGYSVVDLTDNIIRERQLLANDGVIVVSVGINRKTEKIVNGPELIGRGFAPLGDMPDLIKGIKSVTKKVVVADIYDRKDWSDMRNNIKNAVAKYISRETHKNPLIIPVLVNCPTVKG